MTDTTKRVIKEDVTELQAVCQRCKDYVNGLPESDIKQDLDLIVFTAMESVKTYLDRFGFDIEDEN